MTPCGGWGVVGSGVGEVKGEGQGKKYISHFFTVLCYHWDTSDLPLVELPALETALV